MEAHWKTETIAVQGTYQPGNGEPRVLPIAQSTTYVWESAEEIAKVFDLERMGHLYTRISNPTIAAFEEKMAALEGGVGAVATSSGQAAIMMAIMNICIAGQHVVASGKLYGGTVTLMTKTLCKFGIEVTFVDPAASEADIRAAFRPNTRLVYSESMSNPALEVIDFERFAGVAHEMGVPFIVDNTFPSPHLCKPFQHGADIIIHSATKYIDGHAVSVGGVLVDSGKFDWTSGKYPEMTEPDPAYHGVRYVEQFGPAAYVVKARVQLLRDMGCCISPMNAWLSHMGLETLHLRMERHSENGQKLAEWLEANPKVAWVEYPGLPSHRCHGLAKKYMPKGCSGVLSFGPKAGRDAAMSFINNVKLARLVTHVCDVRTSVIHPASTTHRQLSDAELQAAGVLPELVRVSVGIEHIDDIIADFTQALG